MQQEIFNPDFIEPPINNNGTLENEEKKEKKDGFLKRVMNKIFNPKAKLLLGILFGLFGTYLLIAFISFLSSGDVDQSAILAHSSVDLAQNGSHITNKAGAFGALISNTLITQWVGISAFIIAFWFLGVGVSLMGIKKIRFYSFTIVSLICIITLSIVVSFVSLSNDSFILLGGNYGYYVTQFLMNFIGYYGALCVNIFLIALLVVIWFKYIKAIVKTTKKVVPSSLRRKVKVENIEDDSNEEPLPDPDKKVELQNVEMEMPDHTPIKEDIFSEVIDPKKDSTSKGKKVKDNNATIAKIDGDVPMTIINKEIEKASDINQNTYDPTQELSHYKFPPLDLLRKFELKEKSVDIKEQEYNKNRITETLNNYGIPIKNIEVCVGPTVTLFEIIPADGVRISKIKNLEDDIALNLSALGIRIIAPIPGRGTIGIEVPNREPQMVSMRSIIESKKYQECKYDLPMAIGCTISNEVFIADLCKMPHMLVAGATGQGKSVGLNAIIASLLYKKHPAELKFVLIDPKMVEFSLYSKLEHHYLAKLPNEEDAIITDPMKVIATLNSLAIEMDNRYSLLKDAQVRNIKEYNAKFINRRLNPEKGHKYLPYIVVIVDEFCDLIMMAGKEVEMPIARIAQKARAVGIHMIIATQRPSTNVITGIIKANFPGRIAFRVTQMVDSRTILDCTGAQQLIGRGDMLFLANGEMERVQCAFIDTPEVEALCEHIDSQVGYEEAYELPEFIAEGNNDAMGGNITDRDPLFEEAAAFIVAGQTASTSSLQRRYSIGYNRAGKIMDQMEASGIVGPSQGGKPRQVLMDSIQLSSVLKD